ncbi:hypothetical protein KII94_07020 [Leuconostoc gelidum subsp. gasicomitatum]|uniref:hypothetical protein n=1 Tax=Leuconostoc gasicomitatum TaxID=115778 RepID=UPI001CC38614|nr:hypothetical protein [Leuconostoc gasicomitatum]MBQ2636012.1 hypothetical protein [Methanobrevibacter sp.]MBZ5953071.1 hypothetical protein [Leuconostoc gasicomitatum]MBZ5961014.1 hypothetical protein [Leuconostoc gasicomitatum]MBZ5994855.1 hypothetical protein [Leuconostoc gasicomitatum]
MSIILDEQLRFMALEQNGLMKSILTLGISERDLTLISQRTDDEQIKKIANLKIKQLNSEAINENINIFKKFAHLNGLAASIVRRKSSNELKQRYLEASDIEKHKILMILNGKD